MGNQYWSYLLTAVGIAGFILAGRKVWWCWYINIACQGLWFVYAIVTEQYGFIIAAALYTVVFGKNAYNWTIEHYRLDDSDIEMHKNLEVDIKFDAEQYQAELRKTIEGVDKLESLSPDAIYRNTKNLVAAGEEVIKPRRRHWRGTVDQKPICETGNTADSYWLSPEEIFLSQCLPCTDAMRERGKGSVNE